MRGFLTYVLPLALIPAQALAMEISLPPNAEESGRQTFAKSAFSLPVAPFSNGAVRSEEIVGPVLSTVWRFPIGTQTTADVMNALRVQVSGAGFRPMLDCETERCGGFDFRFAMNTLPEPKMHVDLGDFRFLSAVKPGADGSRDFVQLVVSRSPTQAFVQLTQIGEETAAPVFTSTKTPDIAEADVTAAPLTLTDHLIEHGYARLGDLTFETGSADLGPQSFESLEELSDFLRENPDITVALVGHTDAVGSLAPNIALSKRRAESVLSRLVSDFGIARSRLEADGVGYLAPITTNQTEEGRLENRRVEVVITSTR